MGLAEILEGISTGLSLTGISEKAFMDWYPGSFSFTLGDEMQSVIGDNYLHVFGSNARLIFDSEELIFGKLIKKMGVFGKALMGISGCVDFIYGGNTSAHYMGDNFYISRGEEQKEK